jgi:hypothetical protein
MRRIQLARRGHTSTHGRRGSPRNRRISPVFWLLAAAFAAALFALPSAFGSDGPPSIQSDKADYVMGELVTLTGDNWSTAETSSDVHIVVNDNVGQTWQHLADVDPDGAGSIIDQFNLPLTFIATYAVSATQQTDEGTLTATWSFTDANASADLEQCRNGDIDDPNDCEDLGGGTGWGTGNVGSSQAHLAEGYSIPYREEMHNLPTNTDITLVLGYDIKHSGKNAIDYLTHYERLGGAQHQFQFGHPAETVNPTDGIAGLAAGSDTYTIPLPDGNPQPQGSYNSLPPGEKVMTLFGGGADITNVQYVTQGDLTAAQSETTIAVTFRVTDSDAVLAWGGHIAKCADWGTTAGVCNSAAGITGSPYHMRNKSWNLGNEDRSLSADTVLLPGTLIINKTSVGGTDTFNYTGSGTGVSNFSIQTSGSPNGTGSQTFSNIAPGAKTVTESGPPAGWAFTSLVCNDPDGGTTINGQTANVDLDAGETVTCTYTNTRQTGKIQLDKDFVGTGSNVTLKIGTTQGGMETDNEVLAGVDGSTGENTVNTGGYFVSEALTGAANYTVALACFNDVDDSDTINDGDTAHTVNTTTGAVDVASGDDVICRFINTRLPQLKLVKDIVPDSDLGKFDLSDSVEGLKVDEGGDGASSGFFNTTIGSHTVSEAIGSTSPTALSDYDKKVECDSGKGSTDPGTSKTFSLAYGEAVTCTFTNTRRGKAAVLKTVSGAVPASGQVFTFELRSGATTMSDGTLVESKNTDGTGAISFAALLVPGQTYQICEWVFPGWNTNLAGDGPLFVPNSLVPPALPNPNVNNLTVCANFTVTPGQTRTFTVDNTPPPGGRALTIGFWKNWSSCANSSGKGQKPTLDQTLAAANVIGDDTDGHSSLPGIVISATSGSYWLFGPTYYLVLHGSTATPNSAPDCAKAVRLLDKSPINGAKKKASDPAFNLAAQLVAAELNFVAGAATNGFAITAVNQAVLILGKYQFNGITHTNISVADTAKMNCLANQLDKYNNNLVVGSC